ncbi:IS1634 family transposase [bacterium]|nr:IS1634 family transposase [bacterium]
MFLSEKKNSNGLYYLYLMDSSYNATTKRSVLRVVQNFGRAEDFKKDKPDEYAKLVEKYGNKKDRAQSDQEKVIRQFITEGEQAADCMDLLSKIKYVMPQNITNLVLRKLWYQDLQMPKFFDYLTRHEALGIEYSISDIAFYFSMLKLMYPSSYLEGLELSPRFLGDPVADYTSDDVYRCLHVLAEYKDSIMQHVNKKIDVLVPREKTLLFFDCTNCYFETPYNDTYWNRKKAYRILRRKLRKENKKFKELPDKELNRIIDDTPAYTAMLEQIIDSLGDPLRMHGPSKERRVDLPLVSIALVVDEHAIPIDFMVFPGNQAETSTLIEIVRDVKVKHDIRNAVLVADGALNGTKNLSKLLEEGLGFSVAKSALTFSDKLRESELDLDTFEIMNDEAGNPTSMRYKIVDYHNVKYDMNEKDKNGKSTKYTIDCKMMITFSEDRQKRDLAIIEDNVRLAEAAVEKHEQMQVSTNGWKQYVRIGDPSQLNEPDTTTENKADNAENEQQKDNGPDTSSEKSSDSVQNSEKEKKKKECKKQIALSLNEDAISKRKQCAGFAGILYHEPPDSTDEFTPAYVSSLYHQLVQIEECFRIMKNDFEIRPVYVREDQSIKGHVLICVLALIMIRLIQRKFMEEGYSVTAQQLQKILLDLKLMTLSFDGKNCLFLKSLEVEKRNCLRTEKESKDLSEKEIGEKMMKIMNCEMEHSINTLEQIRKCFHLKSLKCSEYQSELMNKYYCNAST